MLTGLPSITAHFESSVAKFSLQIVKHDTICIFLKEKRAWKSICAWFTGPGSHTWLQQRKLLRLCRRHLPQSSLRPAHTASLWAKSSDVRKDSGTKSHWVAQGSSRTGGAVGRSTPPNHSRQIWSLSRGSWIPAIAPLPPCPTRQGRKVFLLLCLPRKNRTKRLYGNINKVYECG